MFLVELQGKFVKTYTGYWEAQQSSLDKRKWFSGLQVEERGLQIV